MDHAIKTGLKATYCSLQSHDLSLNQFLTREWLELEPKFQFLQKKSNLFSYTYIKINVTQSLTKL